MQLLNGPEIVRLRELKRWSQIRLARESGVPQTNLSGYETGRVANHRSATDRRGRHLDPAIPAALADALQVPVEAILRDPDQDDEPDEDEGEAA